MLLDVAKVSPRTMATSLPILVKNKIHMIILVCMEDQVMEGEVHHSATTAARAPQILCMQSPISKTEEKDHQMMVAMRVVFNHLELIRIPKIEERAPPVTMILSVKTDTIIEKVHMVILLMMKMLVQIIGQEKPLEVTKECMILMICMALTKIHSTKIRGQEVIPVCMTPKMLLVPIKIRMEEENLEDKTHWVNVACMTTATPLPLIPTLIPITVSLGLEEDNLALTILKAYMDMVPMMVKTTHWV